MNYMMLIYLEERLMAAPDAMSGDMPKDCEGLAERLMESGHYLSGGILQPTSTATSVRLRGGQRLVTDGPFAETREQLAGYMLVEARDLDEALSIATQHPVAKVGTVEVRPLKDVAYLAPRKPPEPQTV
jgi:hypothetical protein